jgi:hypothetical protein
MLCRPCHSAVHRAADNKTLAQKYNTVEALKEVSVVAMSHDWRVLNKRMHAIPAPWTVC